MIISTTGNFFNRRFSKEKEYKKAPFANFPKNALVELSNACNHACVFCHNSIMERKISNLDINTFKDFIDQAHALGLEEIGLYSTGEPFMTKNIEEFISYASLKLKRVYITTNGALASLDRVVSCYKAGLSSIKFSINGTNEENYKLIHGKDDFNKVLKNVEDIFNWKSKNKIDLQLLCSAVIIPSVFNYVNEHERKFSRFFEDIIYVKSGSQGGQVFSYPENFDADLNKVFFDIDKPNYNLQACDMLWNRVHFTSEGFLTTCCVDYELDLIYSDFNNEELKEGWNNEKITSFRKKHIDGNLENSLCESCLKNQNKPFKKLSSIHTKNNNKSELEKRLRKITKRINDIELQNNV